jgi:hypothetical protein
MHPYLFGYISGLVVLALAALDAYDFLKRDDVGVYLS